MDIKHFQKYNEQEKMLIIEDCKMFGQTSQIPTRAKTSPRCFIVQYPGSHGMSGTV